jgi:triosephosphate isomerase (TIM)
MIIAANLKTNLTRKQTQEYLTKLEVFLEKNAISQDMILFPAQTALQSNEGKVTLGAQNAYPTISGAFTGEIGTQQLDEFGIKTILIGHSERRHILHESHELMLQKFHFFKELGYKIVFCIGEPLDIRQSGDEKMLEYLNAQLDGVDLEYENLIIAYEPVWAIGSGLTPTNEDIEQLHSTLRLTCKAPLLYGGSVKVDNVKEILALENVDGVLVGGAALNVDDFCVIAQTAQNLTQGEI